MAEQILADDHRHTTREDTKRAIRQRTTRGMLTFNTGRVHRLGGELWAVPSTRGGWHKVNLDVEACDCEDFTFYGRDRGVSCRHIYAAAIANATWRSGVKVRTISVAGDPFAYAGERPHVCYEGVVHIGHIVEDPETGEEVEVIDRLPCRRCHAETR